MKNKETIIRKAKIEDMSGILDMVKELAEYEHALDQVSTTVADYEKNFLSGIFDAFVAEIKGEIKGVAIYYMTWSTWKGRMLYLEDFVVSPELRKTGIGQKLFDAYIAEGKKRGCSLLKWQVLDWNDPAVNFYKKNNAIIEQEWWNGKIFLKET